MTKKDENHPKPSLAQQDALKRLDQVEEEKQKPYKKKNERNKACHERTEHRPHTD